MSHPKPQRGQRQFSDTLKRDAVLSYETGRQSVSQICHSLKVSQTSVYKWIDKYSTLKPQGIQIVEKKDSQAAEIARLEADLRRAHQTIANQSIKLDYHQTLHEYLKDELDIDVKKCHPTPRFAQILRPSPKAKNLHVDLSIHGTQVVAFYPHTLSSAAGPV